MSDSFDEDEIPTLVPVNDKRIPVTVITGYLGSGKTTLLHYILLEQQEKKIAVLMNEIGGGMNLDERITVAKSGQLTEEWIELPNGCVCCSAKDMGVRALESLMASRGNIDYIIIETTGLADPGPVASMFWLDKELGSDIYLDGVVTVVDGKYGLKELQKPEDVGESPAHSVQKLQGGDSSSPPEKVQKAGASVSRNLRKTRRSGSASTSREVQEPEVVGASQKPRKTRRSGSASTSREVQEPEVAGAAAEEGVGEWVRQVALADVIILNKMDVTTPQDKEELMTKIRRINAVAEILEATQCRVELDKILDLGMYSTDSDKLATKMKAQNEKYHPEPKHLMKKEVTTYTLRTDGLYSRIVYEDFLQHCLWVKLYEVEVMRVKGLLVVDDFEDPLCVNAVYDTYEIQEVPVYLTEIDSYLTFIGVNVERVEDIFSDILRELL